MKKPADPRTTLLKELRQAAEQIDEQGLLFLLRQAQVLIHNARVDRISQGATGRDRVESSRTEDQETAEEAGRTSSRKPAPLGRGSSGASGRGSSDASSRARSRSSSSAAFIEASEGGKLYFLVIGKVRKVMDGEEVRRLVRVCGGSAPKAEGLQRLFRVLKQERQDILMDAGIPSASSPVLEAIYTAIRGWKAGP